MRTLTGHSLITHQKAAMILDKKGVRSGNHCYLMQPTYLFWYIGNKFGFGYITEYCHYCSMNCTQYLKEAVKNVEAELAKTNHVLKGKPNTPMQPGYRPELDVSTVLGPEQANYYQSLIGVLRWAVELGRIHIHIDVTLLSSYLVQPHIGHLEQVLHIVSYLKHHLNSHLVFDPNYVSWE
jgi:hypothetical protein